MLKEIFRFELSYRKNRAANYIYFGIFFLFSFFLVASPILSGLGAAGQIKPNAPFIIANLIITLTYIFTFITSAVMGVAIIRDFDHNTEAILFSTPMKKMDYLLGRFGGSFLVLLLISCSIWMGAMLGFSIGKFVPWETNWKEKEMLPFNAWSYLHPYLIFTVSNLFIIGSIFFMSGALGRKTILIYTQAIILLVISGVATTFLSDLESKEWAAMLDPFSESSFSYITQYWTPSEKNTLLVPFKGIVLYNRLIWMGIAVATLIGTYYGFSFNVVRNSFIRRKAVSTKGVANPEAVVIPVVKPVINLNTHIQQFIRLSVFYFKTVIKEIPFLAIIIVGMLLLFLNAIQLNKLYGTNSYPTTYSIVEIIIGSFTIFFLIIAIFYSGELVWKERDVKFDLINDAMPMPSFIGLASKFTGLMIIYILMLLVLILCGVIIQMAYGYFKFELGIYFKSFYTGTLAFLALYTLLAIFIQVLVNNKFLGFALCIVFFIIRGQLGNLGLEHNMWRFASGGLGTFSDMNVYGHSVTPFNWYQLYWFAFSIILFSIAVIFSVRGSEAVMNMRWKTGKLRLTKPMLIFTIAVLCTFLFSGAYIYYNTRVINKFVKSDDQEDQQEEYEKTLKKYEFLAQPKITEVNLKVDIYPYDRNFTAEGYFWLKNKTNTPIKDIHIQNSPDDNMIIDYLKFDRETTVKEKHEDFKYFVYELANPIAAGDSAKMNFKTSFITKGFQQDGNTSIVFNGTFFNNQFFPSLGYNENFELGDDDERRKRKMKPKERMLARNDPRGLQQSLFGDDADHIRFEMVVSTADDQIAIAPGYLQKEWKEGDRKFYHYKMDAPMCNFYSIVSARYAVKRDKWNDVNLEIYYHPGHEYNLDKMMQGMKDALTYYTKNFSPYQYRQARIMEFPRYSKFAQSFANTIPFSEGIGFIAKVDDPEKDIDYVYYVTAHEMGHQWWGHQVMEAGVKGNTMLSESMSQYSALMVLKHKFNPELMERYLKYELDRYLRDRTFESKKEQPLELVEGQGYIHYRKASLIFYALQDYIGEDSVNAAFRRFNEEWRFKDAPYPTSADLLKHIKKATPDSLQYIIHDMFETITLFENKADTVTYKELAKDKFEVVLKVSSEKLRADSTGTETNIALNDWIDIGVYTKTKAGKDSLIYLKKHKITKKENEFKIIVKEKPRKAGIDPMHKLIDRHSDDNTKIVVSKK